MSSCFLPRHARCDAAAAHNPLVQLTEGEILSVLSVAASLSMILATFLLKEHEANVV